MPFKKCTTKRGSSGTKYGDSGKCYGGSGGKAKATEQMRAIKASQAKAKKKR